MLSRVANCLFWMSRYFERAEHVARLLDTTFFLELELHGLLAGPEEVRQHWQAQLDILQQPVPDHLWVVPDPQQAIARWLAFDTSNAGSILCCVNRARNNARSIRGGLSSEVWRAVNHLYWELRDPDFVTRATDAPHDYYAAVEAGSHLFQGVCDATLPHDEGWHFLQLGKYLERAAKVIRVLDVKTRHLRGVPESPVANLEWAGVLKACRAYEAYQRLSVGRIDPDRVTEFLLLDPAFPRSARFCLEGAAAALDGIEGPGGRGGGPVDKVLGRVLSDLRYADLGTLMAGDFHGFLGELLTRCSQVGRAVQEHYALAT